MAPPKAAQKVRRTDKLRALTMANNRVGHKACSLGLKPGGKFPNAQVEKAYLNAYDYAFKKTAADTFDNVYQDAYHFHYDEAYKVAYTHAINQDFSQDYKSAYNAAFKASYDAAYKQAYDGIYTPAFQKASNDAYQKAFPTRVEEGRKTGYAQGFDRGKNEAYTNDYNQGFAAGDKTGYDENFSKTYLIAEKKAYQDRVAFFTTHAVFKIDGGEVVDSNHDTIFAPGEVATLKLALRNFGKISQKERGSGTPDLSISSTSSRKSNDCFTQNPCTIKSAPDRNW